MMEEESKDASGGAQQGDNSQPIGTPMKLRKKNIPKKTPTKFNRFKGRCEGLGEHVYDRVGTKQQQAEAFAKTTEEIANYIGKEYTQGYYVRLSVEEMMLYDMDIEKPSDLATGASTLDTEIWKEEVKTFVKTKTTFSSNLKRLYSLIWGQCSDTMKAELESMTGFATIAQQAEPWEL